MQPERPHQQGGPGCSSAPAQGSGLWPHSPPMPRGPSTMRPLMHDAAAAAGAQDDAEHHGCARRRAVGGLGEGKAVGIVGERTGRPEPASRSRSNGRPLSQVELAFCTRPVVGDSEPGMPMPTLPRAPLSASRTRKIDAMASMVAA